MGKTTLLAALRRGPRGASGVAGDAKAAPAPTDGVDVVEWDCAAAAAAPQSDGASVQFSCLDFAGQEAYYTTHQLFLRSSAVYVLVWHPRRGPEECHRQLQFWLKSVAQRVDDNVPVFVVASHHDEGLDGASADTRSRLRAQFPSLRLEFTSVSSTTGHGLAELRDSMRLAALSLPHISSVSVFVCCVSFLWLCLFADWLFVLFCFDLQKYHPSWLEASRRVVAARPDYPAPGL